jgi:hypothetical protein
LGPLIMYIFILLRAQAEFGSDLPSDSLLDSGVSLNGILSEGVSHRLSVVVRGCWEQIFACKYSVATEFCLERKKRVSGVVRFGLES